MRNFDVCLFTIYVTTITAKFANLFSIQSDVYYMYAVCVTFFSDLCLFFVVVLSCTCSTKDWYVS